MRFRVPAILGSAVLAATALFVEPAFAALRPEVLKLLLHANEQRNSGPCSSTAHAVSKACANEVTDDYWIALGNCANVSNAGEREECQDEAKDTLHEARVECGEQHDARLELCDALGEQRYDPDFDPALFDSDFSNLNNPNPYFPLGIGNRWKYAGGDETITVEVLDKTKLIEA